MRWYFLVCLLGMIGCATDEASTSIEIREETPVAPPVPIFPIQSTCETEVATCLDNAFWRVFQRDFDDRLSVHNMMGERLVEHQTEIDSERYADLTFKRAQLGMALILENGSLAVLPTVIPDLEQAQALIPDDPFVQIWLDTMRIALAQINGDRAEVIAQLEAAWRSYRRTQLAASQTAPEWKALMAGTQGIPAWRPPRPSTLVQHSERLWMELQLT